MDETNKLPKTWDYPFLGIVYASILLPVQFSSVAQACPTLWDPLASLSIANSQSLLKLSRWCHPTISPSVVLFSSHLQSFPASVSFQMTLFFASSGQSIGVSASTSVLSMNTQGWSPLGWTGWISLQSKRLSKVFSNTTVQKHSADPWMVKDVIPVYTSEFG